MILEWFIIAYLGTTQLVGPFTEAECQRVKVLLFTGANAVCVEKRMLGRGKIGSI